MKYYKIFLLLICTQVCFAQTSAIDYQSVLTDTKGDVLKNVQTELNIHIIEGANPGTIMYTESHLITTGPLGQINIEIGNGTALLNSMNEVDWSKRNYLDLEIKPEGQASFLSIGERELLSVPYALFALNLRCEQGCPGEKGLNGPKGATGPTGPKGSSSASGPIGAKGPDGNPGKNGMNTLEPTPNIPNNPVIGQVYIDDGTNRTDAQLGFRYFDGSTWSDL